MEIFIQLLKAMLYFISFFVVIFLPSFIMLFWQCGKEKREDLKRDIKAQENWYESIRK